jgi:hypothetical protein
VCLGDPKDLFVERVTMFSTQSTGLIWVQHKNKFTISHN